MAGTINPTDGVELYHAVRPPKPKGRGARKPPPVVWDRIDHDEHVLAAALGGRPIPGSVRPTMLVLCGPSGCGKSTIKRELLEELRIGPHMSIDPDMTRAVLEARGVRFDRRDPVTNKAPGQVMSGTTNAYNERLADVAMGQEKGERPSIVLDTTGQNYGQLTKLIVQAKKAGYEVVFAAIYASWEQCRARIMGRNAKLAEENARLAEEGLPPGRRELPLDVAEGIYRGFMNAGPRPSPRGGTVAMYLVGYPETLEQNVTEVRLYDNDQPVEGAHTLLYHTLDNVVVNDIVPFLFYDVQIQEAEPHLVLVRRGGRKRSRRTRRMRRRKGPQKHRRSKSQRKPRRKLT